MPVWPADRLGPERMLFNARAAVEHYLALETEASGYKTGLIS
jgi:hypothetical protein